MIGWSKRYIVVQVKGEADFRRDEQMQRENLLGAGIFQLMLEERFMIG